MKIHFYRLSDWDTFKEAHDAKAVRVVYVDDAANPSLRTGRAGDIVDAIVEAVDLCAGGEPLQFILTTDDDVIVDVAGLLSRIEEDVIAAGNDPEARAEVSEMYSDVIERLPENARGRAYRMLEAEL